jgi:competence protein ComEC
MRHVLFYGCVGGFITGVLIRSIVVVPTSVALITLGISLLFFCYALWSKEYFYIFISLTLICGTFGIFRYNYFVRFTENKTLEEFVGKNIERQGIVVSEPDERETSVRYVVEINDVRIIVSDFPYSEIEYGDRVRVRGVLKTPENFENEFGREFDYVNYLLKDKILYEIRNAKVERMLGNDLKDNNSREDRLGMREQIGMRINKLLFSVKHAFTESLDRSLSFPESRLAAGLVVAGKRSLPKDIQDEFQKTGTLQVVVLSGYNVTIIAETLIALTKSLSKRMAAGFGIGGIVLFTVMAGGSATIVRGAIMAILVIFAKVLGRRYSVGRALLITGGGMLIYNPMYLAHDPSFQLSFLATAGLIYVSPLLEKRLSWMPEYFGLRGILATTLSAQIAVLPLLIYMTGTISLVAIPANMLISLAVPITMLSCFITGIFGLISMFLAFPISLISFVLLKFILQTVHIFASFPFTNLALPYFPLWLVIVIYICYAVILWRQKNSLQS